jgi:hypothetical protein
MVAWMRPEFSRTAALLGALAWTGRLVRRRRSAVGNSLAIKWKAGRATTVSPREPRR